jgi:hypothetical protein
LKNIAFTLLFFSATLGWSQNFVLVDKLPEESEVIYSEQEYNALLRHTPKAFVPNVKSKPKSKVLNGDLNSISSLELRYAYQQQLKLSEVEIKWMEAEINALATAFFKEGNPIIIKRAGTYGNCSGKGTETKDRDGMNVTDLYLCYTYQNGETFENRFLEIFNERTEKLIADKKKKTEGRTQKAKK